MTVLHPYKLIIKTTLVNPVFIISSLLFIAHQIGEWIYGGTLRLLDSYLDMLLMMPIIMSLWWTERSIILLEIYKITILEWLIFPLSIGIISEIIFPMLSSRFVSDLWDIVVLCIGHLIFYLHYKKSINNLN